jgi:PhzF family phenazine biosynthesis protein
MTDFAFRIVNVFAEERLGGNPLAVFEDGGTLSPETMQALALQFNLSETTFILPSARANARVRIFTPTFEMPFAGHPTLGTAQVARALGLGADSLTLEMIAGVVPVSADGDRWTLEAKTPRTREVASSSADLAAMLGIDSEDLLDTPLWVDTGSEQLMIPLASADAVRRCDPDAAALAKHGTTAFADGTRRTMAYVWARDGAASVVCRFFFLKKGSVVEDPGTGSACANLGGWLVATGAKRPQALSVAQGEAVGRSCQLGLNVDSSGRIFVSGRVIELARGTLSL